VDVGALMRAVLAHVPADALALRRAVRDLGWYAGRLCVDRPERYEVTQDAEGTRTTLSGAVVAVLAELARLTQALTAATARAEAAEGELE
jgi:hypothetical protein